MALETELTTYKSKLPELKGQEGKFVLIKGKNIINIFSSYDDAIKAGYDKFKLDSFLVKRIYSLEEVLHISRFVKVDERAS
jgi:hypothetical protein